MTSTTKRVLKIICTGFIALLILLITISYIYYLEIKKTLISKISSRSSLFIGQKVDIGDMSFSPSAGINFYHIVIKNPDSFAPGELLKIEQVFLKMKYSELFRGRFHFRDITVYSPELTVTRDGKGRLNLSEKLMQFFQKKSTIRYQIDDFTIRDGVLDFNRDKRFKNDHVSLSVKNLSSEQGIKTLIKGTTTYSGENKISFDGWVYLKDEPKKLNISISSQEFALSSMKGILERYGIDTEKTKVSFRLNTNGDTGKGFHLKSEMRIKNGWFSFLRKDIKEILLDANAFLNIRDNSLLIGKISLQAGNVTAATVKGEMKKIQKDFFYTALVKISSLDLSVFNFMKDMKISGIITTDMLKVQGSLKKSIPDVSGIVHLYNAAVRSNTTDIAGINAQVEFLSGKEMTVKTNITTKVSKVYGYLLDRPADVNIALNVRGSPDNMAVTSSVNITPVEMRMENDKAVSVNSIAFAVDSTIRDKTFAGESLIELKGVKVADYAIPWIRSRSTITSKGNSFTATGSLIEGEGFKISAGRTAIKLPGKTAGNKAALEAEIQAEKISILNKNNRNILKEGAIKSRIGFRGKNLDFRADAHAGKITADISGTIERFAQQNRSIKMRVIQPEVRLTDIRDAFWDMFPDSLLYAGMEGSVASDVQVQYSDTIIQMNGTVTMKDLMLQGENGEYSVGPVNGSAPIAYSKTDNNQKVPSLPSFEQSELDNLRKYYAGEITDDGYSRITIRSFHYGFKFLENIDIWMKQEGSLLNIRRFSGNIFGGKLNGSALVDMSEGLNYRAGMLLEGLSLTRLCDDIEPIKGYISGKVEGVASLKGSGTGVDHLVGKADFRTYNTADEKTKISKEFLQKIGGPSLKAYLGDRNFDKGSMSFYLKNGFIFFKELEISNRNFIGMTDLSIKVAPLNNRIAIDHLMWSITEAAQRAQKKNK